MLALTGRKGDGWVPTLGYMKPGDLGRGNAAIDAAAIGAGRDPRDIRRLLNVPPPEGDADGWAESLAAMAVADGIATFILTSDDPTELMRFGQEVAPAVRDAVARER